VWELESLARAIDWLRNENCLGDEHGDAVSIADEALQRVDIRLTQRAL
jgi:hypothetical protein